MGARKWIFEKSPTLPESKISKKIPPNVLTRFSDKYWISSFKNIRNFQNRFSSLRDILILKFTIFGNFGFRTDLYPQVIRIGSPEVTHSNEIHDPQDLKWKKKMCAIFRILALTLSDWYYACGYLKQILVSKNYQIFDFLFFPWKFLVFSIWPSPKIWTKTYSFATDGFR